MFITEKVVKILIFLFVNFQMMVLTEGCAKPRIVGYYPEWYHASFPAEKIEWENLTDVIHAFIWPNADGSLVIPTNFDYPELLNQAWENGTNLLVALGGWGQSAGFPAMAADPAARKVFIDNLVEFCESYGYNGVDIDWEHPANSTDRANLTTLVREMRAAFDAADSELMITMAVPSGSWTASIFDFKALHPYLNWFGCMCYDFHGSWSDHAGHNAPLYAPANEPEGSADLTIRYLISQGIPKNKIILGIPFYGRHFYTTALYEPATGGTDVLHRQIDAYLKSGWTYHWDDLAKVPYLKNPAQTQLITFDDTTSVRIKTEYAQEKELGGVMIWALGQDFSNNQQPLLESIARASQSSAIASAKNNLPPAEFGLQPNFPNPFNSVTQIHYFLGQPTAVKLEVVNLQGQRIQILTKSVQPAGWHQVKFDATGLAAGIYYVLLRTPDFQQTGKMIFLP